MAHDVEQGYSNCMLAGHLARLILISCFLNYLMSNNEEVFVSLLNGCMFQLKKDPVMLINIFTIWAPFSLIFQPLLE